MVCDPETGEPIINQNGGYDLAEAGAPYSYVTESDYYDNKGYYILSNLAPGEYRLRFTFPKEYAGYTLSTRSIGPDDDGDGVADTAMTIEHRADDPATADVDETALVATSDVIQVDAVAFDEEALKAGQPDQVHAAYDARMTSYDVALPCLPPTRAWCIATTFWQTARSKVTRARTPSTACWTTTARALTMRWAAAPLRRRNAWRA